MMEAVARRKASWLFGAGSDKSFSGKRRPQEDMVTSAVFGSIRLMSPEDRYRAVEVLLGSDACSAAAFVKNVDIEVDLWPRLPGLNGRRHVEPDVLLKATGRNVIVEVKWHAPLSKRQLDHQIEAVGAHNVDAVVMLGEADVDEMICNKPSFRRTWRDVSGEFQIWLKQNRGDAHTPLGRWIAMMCAFLQETDMGRVFGGLSGIADPGQVAFRFSKPGHPPWFDLAPSAVQHVRYTFEGKS